MKCPGKVHEFGLGSQPLALFGKVVETLEDGPAGGSMSLGVGLEALLTGPPSCSVLASRLLMRCDKWVSGSYCHVFPTMMDSIPLEL